MNVNAAQCFLRVGSLFVICLLTSLPLPAQVGVATLSGTLTDPSGKPLSNAKVSVKNVATGQSTETQTNAVGVYSLPDLAPGNYEVSVSAEGFSPKTATVTLAAGAKQSLDFALAAAPGLSLQDLGFSSSQTRGNPQEQAILDRRSHMLKTHQRLGLITTGPMVATIITSLNAKPHRGTLGTTTGTDVHAALGAATVGMYFTTAYFAIRAPKVPDTPTRGPIRVHKALAWIHGTGMVLTPILGEMAYSQLNRGERVHGIAKAHGPVAVVTGAAYGAALLSVSVKF